MEFRIYPFLIRTRKETETLQEQILKPIMGKYSNKPEGYEWQYKTREFTVFDKLEVFNEETKEYVEITSNLFDFIDLIEILKAFSSNKLAQGKIYRINDVFAAKIFSKKDNNPPITLGIQFINLPDIFYLDKYECNSFSAKFSKILQRCEAWQEQGA